MSKLLILVWVFTIIYAWFDLRQPTYHIFAYLFIGSTCLATILYTITRVKS